jgi:hypothetical protein
VLFAHLPEPPTLEAKYKSGATPPREVYMPRLFNHDPYNGDTAKNVLALTPLQYVQFQQWAADNFVSAAPEPEFLCDALTRIALEACSGGAFYPGMEAPRILCGSAQQAGVKDVYHDELAFRIDPAKAAPGEITAGLARPWQADFHACAMERDNAWWPATRPDLVLIEKPGRPVDSMSEEMYVWSESVQSGEDMVASWHKLGILRRERVPDAQVPLATDPEALKEFKSSNYDEVEEGGATAYYYFVEKERTLPPHQKKSSGF